MAYLAFLGSIEKLRSALTIPTTFDFSPDMRRHLAPLSVHRQFADQRVHCLPAAERICSLTQPLALLAQLHRELPNSGIGSSAPGLLSAISNIPEAFGEHLSLGDMCMLSMASHTHRASVISLLQTTAEMTLDAAECNFKCATVLACLPALRKLHVRARDGHTTTIDVGELRAAGQLRLLDTCSAEAALIAGALAAHLDCTLLTRCGREIPLRSCREAACIRLRGEGMMDADIALLLGALSCNRCTSCLPNLREHPPFPP